MGCWISASQVVFIRVVSAARESSKRKTHNNKTTRNERKVATTFQHLYTPEIVLRCVQIVVFLNSVVVISFVGGGGGGCARSEKKKEKKDKRARRGASESQSAER
jgi:hypothetical protein